MIWTHLNIWLGMIWTNLNKTMVCNDLNTSEYYGWMIWTREYGWNMIENYLKKSGCGWEWYEHILERLGLGMIYKQLNIITDDPNTALSVWSELTSKQFNKAKRTYVIMLIDVLIGRWQQTGSNSFLRDAMPIYMELKKSPFAVSV